MIYNNSAFSSAATDVRKNPQKCPAICSGVSYNRYSCNCLGYSAAANAIMAFVEVEPVSSAAIKPHMIVVHLQEK
jgi:hypothetical protein